MLVVRRVHSVRQPEIEQFGPKPCAFGTGLCGVAGRCKSPNVDRTLVELIQAG